jgi:hypothetical protein
VGGFCGVSEQSSVYVLALRRAKASCGTRYDDGGGRERTGGARGEPHTNLAVNICMIQNNAGFELMMVPCCRPCVCEKDGGPRILSGLADEQGCCAREEEDSWDAYQIVNLLIYCYAGSKAARMRSHPKINKLGIQAHAGPSQLLAGEK